MIEHLIIVAAPAAVSVDGGRILGTVGAGGIATALTVALIAGTRSGGAAPAAAGGAPGGGGKKPRIRKKLTSDQAQWTGVAAGTLYMTAGSIWTVGGQVSTAFSQVFTNGGFGAAGSGAVALGLGAVMYFREFSPGKSAILGILAAGVWAEAGGLWGLPKALILTGAHAIGLT